MAAVLLVVGAMQDEPVQARSIPERDLEELLLRLEVDLLGPARTPRERDAATAVHATLASGPE